MEVKKKSNTESHPKKKTNSQPNQFENFIKFAQKIVKVPKTEIDEQEKKYQAEREKVSF